MTERSNFCEKKNLRVILNNAEQRLDSLTEDKWPRWFQTLSDV